MRTSLVLATLFAVGGIGGTGQAAPLAHMPTRADDGHVVPRAYAVDRTGLAAPLGTCEDIAGDDRASCRKLEAAIADARRTLAFADLSRGWEAARRAAFARLIIAQEAYAEAVGAHETDRAAGDGAAAVRAEKDAFLKTLRAVVRGDGAAGDDARGFVALDAGLNAAYAHVMETPDAAGLGWGSVDKAGVRRTERAWLAYRDAFVGFAATLEAPHAIGAVKAELTRRRTASLEALLAD